MSFEKCRSKSKRKEEREEQEETCTEAGRGLKTSIEAGKKHSRCWDVEQRGKAREGPLREVKN